MRVRLVRPPSGDWSAYWDARNLRPLAGQIRASVLQVQGLQDRNVKPNAVDDFWNNLTSEKRLAAYVERCTARPAFKRAFDAQIGDFRKAA